MYFVLFGVIIVIVVLLGLLIGLTGSNGRKAKKIKEDRQKEESKPLNLCPLCGSALKKGEDLFTRIYRPMNVHDQLCTINGCPHCYPHAENGIKRECPVCHKSVDQLSGHLVARLFNYEDKKKHVIVTGCNKCCREAK